MTGVADQLRGIPLFAGVAGELVEAVAARATHRRLVAGEWLFHVNDPGDTLYVVAAGSIELLGETGTASISVLGRGEAIGELSLLTGEPRSASARARRDTDVIAIRRDDFNRMLDAEPGFALALVRVLGERLRVASAEPVTRRPRTIAVLPLHEGTPVDSVVEGLYAELAKMGAVVRFAGPELSSEALDQAEAANDWVLLAATSASRDDSWTSYCIRQADRVIALAARAIDVVGPGVEQLSGCDIAYLSPSGSEPELEGWLDVITPRAIHVLRDGGLDGIRRTARRLAGRSVGVVLSGGGARGLAHIGVLEELQRAGVVIDRIGAVSMGATIGSLFAEGRPVDEVAEIVDATYVRDTPLRGRTIPIVALSRGVHGFAAQHRIHGERRIEGLDIPFYCVSSDLAAQSLVVHRRGLVAVAVSASQALPAFVPPVQDGERMLLDGAIFSNLPVQPMREMGEGPVIAVDVSGRLPRPRPPRSRVPFVRRWIAGPAAAWAPPITETVLRSILLGNVASDAAARESADVVIQPQLRGVSTMRFRDLEGIRRLGRDAVQESIASGALSRVVG